MLILRNVHCELILIILQPPSPRSPHRLFKIPSNLPKTDSFPNVNSALNKSLIIE